MCQLSNLSLAEMQAVTKAQLITLALANRPPVAEPSYDTIDAMGRLTRRATIYRKPDGRVACIETVKNVYYENGDILSIEVKREDETGKCVNQYRVDHPRGLPLQLAVLVSPAPSPGPVGEFEAEAVGESSPPILSILGVEIPLMTRTTFNLMRRLRGR